MFHFFCEYNNIIASSMYKNKNNLYDISYNFLLSTDCIMIFICSLMIIQTKQIILVFCY